MMTMKNDKSSVKRGSMALLLILMMCSVPTVTAQEKYVLTNGTNKWYDRIGAVWTEDYRGMLQGTWEDFHKEVPNPEETRINIHAGDTYLALDTSSTGGGPTVTASAVLTPFCVWNRTSRVGYYYQEHVDAHSGTTYIYYLLSSPTPTLYIHRIEKGDALDNVSVWYDWDFGVAIQQDVTTGSWTSSRYYWLMLDRDGNWTMSNNSYERPETRIYEDANGDFYHYYDNVEVSGENKPRGQGALFMPVTTEYTAKSVTMPVGKGLTDLASSRADVAYGESTVLTPTITFSDGGDDASVVEGYYTYVVETDRTDINEDWTQRDEDVAGSAGIPTTMTRYFWDSDPTTAQLAPPTAHTETMNVGNLAKVCYTFPSKAMRYIDTARAVAGDWTSALNVHCVLLPRTDIVVTATATDYYANGAVGTSRTVTFTLKAGVSREPVEQYDAPMIGGDVFGGGRMADVHGDTKVTIHNCDSIRSVFGGNDIAGTVTGGSTVTIGTDSATVSTGIYIGSVYGGGNGYYKYNGVATVDAAHTHFNGHVYAFGDTGQTGLTVVDTLFADGVIPAIGTTHVVMNNDLARVDSLFGGAKNAFVSGDGNAVTVDQNAGTVFAEFGGNNYGGALTGSGALTTVNVNGTKTKTDAVVENGHDSGFGYDFGVRYLFGGGNRVDAIRVAMNIRGGMVDTCFAGGNSATVTTSSECNVNTPGDGGSGDQKIYVNDKGLLTGSAWVGGKGIYNVRCLFAGNNLATMAIIPAVQLVRGGLGTVYGGGNRGDMNYDVALNTTDFPVDIDPSTDSINLPSKIGTYVIVDGSGLDIDYLYGGCRMSNVLRSTYVRVNAGNVGTVFGGCNISGDVGTTDYYKYADRANVFGTYVVVSGTANIRANVFAGANGDYHCNAAARTGDINSYAYTDAMQFTDAEGTPFDPYDDYVGKYIPTHNNTNLIIRGGTVHGNVYGGANLANVGYSNTKYIRHDNVSDTDAELACPTNHGSVHLTMNGGLVKGNMYGGGNMASINGLSYLLVQGSSIIEGSLYAGNDRVGQVISFGPYTSHDGRTDGDFKASDSTVLNKLDGSEYNANFSTYVLLKGTPAIGSVYGSGNGAYNYDGTRPWYPSLELCDGDGNNRPIQSSTFIDINTSGKNTVVEAGKNAIIDTVFGGGNGVSVSDVVTVLLNCGNNTDYYVGTIFGGNNRDDMNNCVPTIDLKSGKVYTVYGGGNAGNMNEKKTFPVACGEDLENVSTRIVVNSAAAAIDTIYGGCNMSDVAGMAYIDIRQTSPEGIGWVFGGNNVSGSVSGNTRIDVNGGVVHNIYGGSNGYYDYRYIGGEGYSVYSYGHLNDPSYLIATQTSGVPEVSYAQVNIFGGTVDNNVYGGGRMGDCDSTLVVVNDRYAQENCGGAANSATINGVIYGGGEGVYDNLDAERRGNVKQKTTVELYHASALTGAKAYGGGRGGNVYHNTYLTVHEGWDIPFDEIYGGCWGSDLVGTAHLYLHGKENAGDTVARRVFGGNDYTGYVTACEVNVYSGNYGKIYGAGNGDSNYVYNDAPYSSSPLQVPNAESVVINFYGGNVRDNIYGGGCLGTTLKHKKDANGDFVLENNRRVPDTTYGYQLDATGDFVYANGRKVRVPLQAHSSVDDYAYTIVNFHGGTADNIYAGGEGKDKLNVYGLKILNMDGGLVYESVYGGSERVDDGYPSECDSVGYSLRKQGPQVFTHTTKRPSSVVNIVGGTVTTSVYGGGYLGDAYGSTYVNIGQTAVDTCPVWTNTYRGTDSAYWKFKPGAYIVDAGGDTTWGNTKALTPSDLYLELSVYGGANWGSNVGSSYFTKPGIFGGETRVSIDGYGYNTGEVTSSLPKMNINESVIGSGTSALAGDILTRIDIRNYGGIASDCEATKEIKSVQRADELWLHNTAINYTGTTDAVSAYPSENFTINRVDTVNACGYNMINLEALMTNIEELNFYKQEFYGYRRPTADDLVDHQTLYFDDADQCGTSPTICTQLHAIDPVERPYTAVLISNGVNIDIMTEESYGPVKGFAYLLAEDGTNAMVTALSKSDYVSGGEDGHTDGGGFMSTCKTANKVISEVSSDWDLTWTSTSVDSVLRTQSEFQYDNYTSTYRVWSLGKGRRSRYAVILAHTNYEKMDEDKQLRTTELVGHDTGDSLAIARATLTLPTTANGHYYKLSESAGIIITEQNSKMKLADQGWMPDNWEVLPETSNTPTSIDALGDPVNPLSGTGVLNTTNVISDPGYTFGLVMACGRNFGTSIPTGYNTTDHSVGKTLISGNKNVNIVQNFVTYKVSDHDNTSPEMDFYMTYNHDFSNTILGTVRFTLDEYDSTGANLNNPINVVVTIATIVDEFKDMNYEVLAMYNEGRSNTFTRKAVFPATLQHRDLYLKKVLWQPTDGNGEPVTTGSEASGAAPDQFYMTGDENLILNSTDNNRFALAIQPVNNVTTDLTSNIGWHTITQKSLVDLHNLIKDDAGSLDKISGGTLASTDTVAPSNPSNERGLKLGELDGRGLAALNIQLTFNGDNIYPAEGATKGYVGRAVLTLESFGPTGSAGEFHITVYVKCREHGDTIYMASANTLSKTVDGHTYTLNYDASHLTGTNAGKTPGTYVQTFEQALSDNIYEEGDVIAIMDTVRVGANGEELTIQGSDYSLIPIIRYSGHHYQFPGKECAYRGTMINVTPDADKTTSFTARCIDFIGSSVCKTIDGGAVVPDTLIANAPIIAVHGDGAVVNLQSNVVVEDNFNSYTGGASERRGAISVSNSGTLNIVNSVDIYNNITKYNVQDGHRDNGTVYVDGGTVNLQPSHSESAVTIHDNFLMTYSGATPSFDFYKEIKRGDTALVRYAVDTTHFTATDTLRANVYLTRTAPTSGTDIYKDMADVQSDIIYFTSRIPDNTLIGITKWLPGATTRDTIRITVQESGNYTYSALAAAKNFVADEARYTIFYSDKVDDHNIYLHQCATFRYQTLDKLFFADNARLKQGNALEYIFLDGATCPNGGDKIMYRVVGGLFPYTYTWSGSEAKTRTTLSNVKIAEQLADADTSGYLDAVYDSMLTRQLFIPHNQRTAQLNYTALATDVAGCRLTKTVDVTLEKSDDNSITPFVTTGTVANWTNQDTAVTATGKRQYKAIHITPRVWADRDAGTVAAKIEKGGQILSDDEDVSNLYFCEGDIIVLHTEPASSRNKFIMWDFAPYYEQTTRYVVPAASTTVTAYYGPNDYWKDTVISDTLAGAVYDSNFTYTTRPTVEGYISTDGSNKAGMVTTYNGDLHIYDENGLAWLISCVNGFNGTQARTFHFNRVYIHYKDGGYDMKKYLWTPMGTPQHPFEGMIIGVGGGVANTAPWSDVSSTDTTWTDPVVIKNIIVDEPNLSNAGFFAVLDSARIVNIELQGALVRGAQNVGTLAAQSSHSRMRRVNIKSDEERDAYDATHPPVTLLSTRYISGGMIGLSTHDTILQSRIAAKFVGDAVYSGGGVGYGTSTIVQEVAGRNDSRLRGLYTGGIIGYSVGTAGSKGGLFRPKTGGEPSIVQNNYWYVRTDGGNRRMGGVAGYAQNSIIANNYIYGDIEGSEAAGGVLAVASNGTRADHNYYEASAAKLPTASETGNAMVDQYSAFEGQGNRVTLEQNIYGVNNLTRVLNKWVREQNAAGADFQTWRSDLTGLNNGYPVFGQPDTIPVETVIDLDGCEEVEWDGVSYTADMSLSTNIVDPVEMIDSTTTIHIHIHHNTATILTDTALVDEGYEGYGFTVTPTEAMLLNETILRYGTAQMVLSDTLSTVFGCDSVVTLTLTFTGNLDVPEVDVITQATVKVYPNPTVDVVNVEAEGLMHVELYDNEGRTMADYDATDGTRLRINVTHLASGIYYLRVHTTRSVTIQKFVKK